MREPHVNPRIYFRYYTDVENDPQNPNSRLNSYLHNLHSSESLVFKWPKVGLQAPSYDPLLPLDYRKTSVPLLGKDATNYRLDSSAPIFFTQSSRRVDAGAYLLAQSPQPSQPTSAPPLVSTCSRKNAPQGGKELTIEISCRVLDGRIELEVKSNLGIEFGLAFSKEASLFTAGRSEVKQTAVDSFDGVKELGYAPPFLQRIISVIHLPPNEAVSFVTKTGRWRFESTPIFLILDKYLVPAGRASIYAPNSN